MDYSLQAFIDGNLLFIGQRIPQPHLIKGPVAADTDLIAQGGCTTNPHTGGIG